MRSDIKLENFKKFMGYDYRCETYKGKTICLSMNLLTNQKVSEENFNTIMDLHKQKEDFYELESLTREQLQELTEIEFRTQELWGFSRNPVFHYWSFYHPKCTCPKMDNSEYIGYTDMRIIVQGCPIHYHKEETDE